MEKTSSRVRLTAGRIDGFKPTKGKREAFLWDTEAPGLAVRALDSGVRTFIYQALIAGTRKSVRIVLGDARVMDLDRERGEPDGGLFVPGEGARQAARRLAGLCRAGIDPRRRIAELEAVKEAAARAAVEAEAAKAAEAQRQSVTFGEAWGAYLDFQRLRMARPNAERGTCWGVKHLEDHERLSAAGGLPKKRGGKGLTKPGVIHPLMGLSLRSLTAEILTDWQQTESRTRATSARKGFELVRGFARWADSRPEYAGLINMRIFEAREVRDSVPRPRTKPDDCLQREMLPAWFAEVRKLPPVVSAYLQALLLTGARREEIARLEWENVDALWKSLVIADKVEGERTIPLTPHVESLLLDLRRRNNTVPAPVRILHGKKVSVDVANWSPSPLVFAAGSASGRLEDPTRAHNRALAAAGLPHTTLHGLRRSFATLAEWIEMPVGIVAQIQGHKPSATVERHYRRRPLDLLRLWHIKYEQWILDQAGIEQPAQRAPLELVKKP
ncbi:MAG: integrase family protein [Rhodocyclaceae bacterium]|nr:integrase family protein [Rhodocyclaceae bacterium]